MLRTLLSAAFVLVAMAACGPSEEMGEVKQAGTAPPTSLITNGSFESGDTWFTTEYNAHQWPGTRSHRVAGQYPDVDPVYFPTQGLKFLQGHNATGMACSDSQNNPRYCRMWCSNTVQIAPNSAYSFSARMVSISTGTSTVTVRMVPVDAQGAPSADQGAPFITATLDGANGWQTLSDTFYTLEGEVPVPYQFCVVAENSFYLGRYYGLDQISLAKL